MPKTMTAKALAANRANAQKSTGPRTPEGKARSRWNALKHGLRARALIPEPLQAQESPAEFAAVLEELQGEFAPATPFEEMLVEAILPDDTRVATLMRYEAHIERQLVRAYNLLERVQRRRRAQELLSPAADPARPDPPEGTPEEYDPAEPSPSRPVGRLSKPALSRNRRAHKHDSVEQSHPHLWAGQEP